MGLAASSLHLTSTLSEIFFGMYTDKTDVEIQTKRIHSMRKRAWYVAPIEDSRRMSQTDMFCDVYHFEKHEKVLCGHLFNASAERDQLGLVDGGGEECPISLEPIADARLPFSDKIRVDALNPELTGVELLCGHRFSSVYLLWHWARSPMLCPMCRASYSLKMGITSAQAVSGIEEDTRPCRIENFPRNHWKKLRSVMRSHKKEEEAEERRLIASYHTESVLDETLEIVLGPAQQFFLMVSLSNAGGPDIIQYMPLYRTNDNLAAITEDTFRFSVERASLRRFTAAVNRSTVVDQNRVGIESRTMHSSVVLRVGDETDEQSFFLRGAHHKDV
jgi:hypothetical protein